MSYPTNQNGMAGCPEGFKKARFPEILIEYWLDVSQFDGQYGHGGKRLGVEGSKQHLVEC